MSWLRRFLRNDRMERELDAELRFHFELLVGGILASLLLLKVMNVFLVGAVPRGADVHLNMTVVTVAMVVSILSSMLASVAPALRLSNADPNGRASRSAPRDNRPGLRMAVDSGAQESDGVGGRNGRGPRLCPSRLHDRRARANRYSGRPGSCAARLFGRTGAVLENRIDEKPCRGLLIWRVSFLITFISSGSFHFFAATFRRP
jgi:uncharacterized membrane protein